nr:protein FAM210B [Pogona vitticeps]
MPGPRQSGPEGAAVPLRRRRTPSRRGWAALALLVPPWPGPVRPPLRAEKQQQQQQPQPAAAARAMLWLGPPCALHALSPGALPPLQAACRSLARGETARCNLPGARALVGLLCGHGEATPHADASRRATGGESRSLGSRKDTGGSPGNDHTDPSQKPNKSQQLKKVFKEYGGVAVAFHVGISLMSLGMFYLAVSSGVDMTAILFKLGFDEAVVQSKLAAGTSTFLLAYAIHKLFAPVRISITLISVPLLVRYFRKIGFFKPPSPNP